MKAEITTNQSGVKVPNFGIHTRDPLVYFIDVDIDGDGRLERFLCPVDSPEFDDYLIGIKELPANQVLDELRLIDRGIATDLMASFLNEKSKDWYLVDEGNERVPINELIHGKDL